MGYSIEWIADNVIVTLSGKIKFADIDAADGLLYGGPRFERMEYQLFDLTNVEEFNLTDQELMIIGTLDKNAGIWNKRIKVALVTKDKKVIKLIETYQMVMSDTAWKVKVFAELGDAKKWCRQLPS